jgi:hypothetical protein
VCSRKISVSIKSEVSDLHERHKIANFRCFGVAGCSQRVAFPSIGGVQNAVWVCASTVCPGSKPDEQEDDCNKCANDRFFHAEHSWRTEINANLGQIGPKVAPLAWHFPQDASGHGREQAAKGRTA